jgi:hypothetical protein
MVWRVPTINHHGVEKLVVDVHTATRAQEVVSDIQNITKTEMKTTRGEREEAEAVKIVVIVMVVEASGIVTLTRTGKEIETKNVVAVDTMRKEMANVLPRGLETIPTNEVCLEPQMLTIPTG